MTNVRRPSQWSIKRSAAVAEAPLVRPKSMESVNRMKINKVKILRLNVNGWQTNASAMCNILKVNPEIIIIAEHEIDSHQNRIKIFNYNVITTNPSAERYDGVAIAIRNDLSYKIEIQLEAYLAITLIAKRFGLYIHQRWLKPGKTYRTRHTRKKSNLY